MLDRMHKDEGGFTLIELLVVILIIGILAAIALPSFLGQQTKGQDSSAKSDVRNLVSQMESCYADTQDYSACTVTKLGNTGLNLSAGASPASGEVAIAAAGTNTYTLTAKSKSLNTFTIQKTSSGTLTHSCAVPPNNNEGGCQNVSGGAGTW